MVLATEKKIKSLTWCEQLFFSLQTVQKKAWRSSLHGWMNGHSLYHSLLNHVLYKKALLNLLLLVFFLFGLSLSFVFDSEKGLFMVSLGSLFDIFPTALLLNALSLVPLLLITLSFFSLLFGIFSLVSFLLNTLILLFSVPFDAFSLGIFVSFSELKKECNSFLPFFVLAFSVRVYVTMKCCFCFNKYFFYTWYKMIRWPSC